MPIPVPSLLSCYDGRWRGSLSFRRAFLSTPRSHETSRKLSRNTENRHDLEVPTVGIHNSPPPHAGLGCNSVRNGVDWKRIEDRGLVQAGKVVADPILLGNDELRKPRRKLTHPPHPQTDIRGGFLADDRFVLRVIEVPSCRWRNRNRAFLQDDAMGDVRDFAQVVFCPTDGLVILHSNLDDLVFERLRGVRVDIEPLLDKMYPW